MNVRLWGLVAPLRGWGVGNVAEGQGEAATEAHPRIAPIAKL